MLVGGSSSCYRAVKDLELVHLICGECRGRWGFGPSEVRHSFSASAARGPRGWPGRGRGPGGGGHAPGPRAARRGQIRAAPVLPPRSVAAAITAAGDLVSQTVWEGRELIDRPRLLVCTALGYALEGAALQGWYAFLHRLPPATLGWRLLWHHAAYAPLAITAFLAGTATCAGCQPWKRVQQELWPAICAHCAIVAPTQLVNAWLVPKTYQVLVANSCAFVWATVLSRLSHRSLPCS